MAEAVSSFLQHSVQHEHSTSGSGAIISCEEAIGPKAVKVDISSAKVFHSSSEIRFHPDICSLQRESVLEI